MKEVTLFNALKHNVLKCSYALYIFKSKNSDCLLLDTSVEN